MVRCTGRYLGLMLIAHLEHGEVYVPSIEKTFFRSIVRGKKNLVEAAGFFAFTQLDRDDLATAAMVTRHEGGPSTRLERPIVFGQNV